jgi:hypothetical protein
MRWVIGLLVFLAVCMAFMIYVFRPWPDHVYFGGFFLAIGIANVLFSKTNGRKFFARTQASPPFIARVWACGGERGVQVLFVGIGAIFTVAGCVVIVGSR